MANERKKRRKRKSKSRYRNMKKVARTHEKREDKPGRIDASRKLSEWWRQTKQLLKSKIFRRTAIIAATFLLMGGGLFEVQRSIAAEEQRLAMEVSPSNQPLTFALSGTGVQFRPQFRSDDTYIIPFEIDGLENLSLNPEDYIVQVQGTNQSVDPNISARLVLFGTSGRGAILSQGQYTGEPLNFYLISTNSLMSTSGERVEVTSEEITQMQAEQGNLIINEDPANGTEENTNGDAATGTIMVGGQEMVVGLDMVATRLNPSADNVTPTYRPVTINSSTAEIYDVTFGAVDRSTIITNKENAETYHEDMVNMMDEYHSRLQDDPNVTAEDAELIQQASEIAYESLGGTEDNERMQDLLSQTSEYSTADASEATSDNIPISEMTEEQRREYLAEDIDTDSLGISQQTSTIEALDTLRQNLVDLNYQIALYDVELSYVDEVTADQDSMGRSAVRYDVLTPFE